MPNPVGQASGAGAAPSAAWSGGIQCQDPTVPPTASYPLLRVQEDLGVKQLVTVTVLTLPLGHQFAEVGGITDEAWGWGTHRDRHLASGL